MTEYFKKFTMDKDGVTIIDFGENEVYECKYSDEAKSLCNCLNDLDYEKYNLKKENEQLKIDLGIAEDNRKLDKEIIDDIHNEFQKVKEENEQLKSQREDFKRGLAEKDKEIMKLRRENNQMMRILNDW